MTDSPTPMINLTRPDGKKHRFTFGENLSERLKAEGIIIAQVDEEGVSHKVEMHEKRGLEVIFYATRQKGGKEEKEPISLDQVVKKLIKGRRETPEQLNALRGNLVHALLQHYEDEASTLNGCLSACFIETFSPDDTTKDNPRYFVGTNLENVNPEEYADRGCAETMVSRAARIAYGGDYMIEELHLRCYFTDPETNAIKFSHGKQCLCGVCRDVCDGLWTEEAKVWLHPINGDESYLGVEEKDSPTGLDQNKISVVPASSMLPEQRIGIQNQQQARSALDNFEEMLETLTRSNKYNKFARQGLEEVATHRKWELQRMLAAVPDEETFTLDVMELQDGKFLETINGAMVARLKQEIYTHLRAEDVLPCQWQDALPDEIEIVAGVNPKTGHVAISAGRQGADHASTPVVTAHLAEDNSNVRGMNEIFYMKFDKAQFLRLLSNPEATIKLGINEDAEIEVEHSLPGGNHRERAVKQKVAAEHATERELIQSDSGKVERQITRQRWTAIPLNDGSLSAHQLKAVVHQSTAERLLGDWQGVKISTGVGKG